MSILATSQYFTTEECTCRCGCGAIIINDTLVALLDKARSLAKIPFNINSWTRCPANNEASGGKPDSAHLTGLAVDISASDSRTRFVVKKALLEAGFTRIGTAKSFIHADIDATKDQSVEWLYS